MEARSARSRCRSGTFMTTAEPTPCPSCGAPGAAPYCSHCGAPRAGGPCRACGGALAPTARFCPRCGHAVGATAGSGSRDRLPWLVAAAALVGMLAAIFFGLSRQPAWIVEPETAGAAEQAGGAPPDLTNMSPRERFDRLYN